MPSNFDIFLPEPIKIWTHIVILYMKSKEILDLTFEVLIIIEFFLISMKKLLKIEGFFRPLINFTSAFDSMDMFFKLREFKISLWLLICLKNLCLWYHCQNQARQKFKCIRVKWLLDFLFTFKLDIACKSEGENNYNYPSL